jgi:hypothetical protein
MEVSAVFWLVVRLLTSVFRGPYTPNGDDRMSHTESPVVCTFAVFPPHSAYRSLLQFTR